MFKRYSSIENSYQNKYILNSLSRFPEMKDESFIAQEKLDGANIQLFFRPYKELKVGKRSSFIEKDNDFYDIWNTLTRHKESIDKLQAVVNETGDTFRLYGEIVGPGINGRVNYGPENTICFFDLEMNGFFVTPENFYNLMKHIGIPEVVPIIGIYNTLQEALKINPEFISPYFNQENNYAEGVVIKPYQNNIILGDSRFILKKKSDKFKEKESNKKESKKEDLSSEVIGLMLEFKSYINDNRILSAFSKEGPIQKPQEMGKYIKLILEDAKEDFLKENVIPDTLNEKEQKQIFNVGSLIADKLRSHL